MKLENDVLRSVLSIAITESILKWINMCVTSHPSCYERRSESMPKRFIDVQNCQGRLVTASQRPGIFVALSYFWRTTDQYKTTDDEIVSHYREIPFYAMSTTHQGAVIMTRQLGITTVSLDRGTMHNPRPGRPQRFQRRSSEDVVHL